MIGDDRPMTWDDIKELGLMVDLADDERIIDALCIYRVLNMSTGDVWPGTSASSAADSIIRNGLIKIASDLEEFRMASRFIDEDEEDI